MTTFVWKSNFLVRFLGQQSSGMLCSICIQVKARSFTVDHFPSFMRIEKLGILIQCSWSFFHAKERGKLWHSSITKLCEIRKPFPILRRYDDQPSRSKVKVINWAINNSLRLRMEPICGQPMVASKVGFNAKSGGHIIFIFCIKVGHGPRGMMMLLLLWPSSSGSGQLHFFRG